MAFLLFPDFSVALTVEVTYLTSLAGKANEGGWEELRGFPDPTETWRLRKPSVLSGKYCVPPWALEVLGAGTGSVRTAPLGTLRVLLKKVAIWTFT